MGSIKLTRWLSVLTALIGVGLAVGTSNAEVSAPESASVRLSLPQVLSPEDETYYLKLFTVQEAGQWKEADKLIRKIENPVLLGHAQAQRYLHPRKYRSKYKELKVWLDSYADHPQASQIHKLALRRKPSNWRAPQPPQTLQGGQQLEAQYRLRVPGKKRTTKQSRWVRSKERQIRRSLRRGHTLVIKKLLQSKDVKRLFSDAEYDRARAQLGQGYFSAGRDEWALQWAGDAANRSGKYVPEGHWTAALAAWRLKRPELAVTHFEKAALLSEGGNWFHSGAAFWAARANLVTRNPSKVHMFLEMAASQPRTFYGQLANRLLGRAVAFKWEPPVQYTEINQMLISKPRGHRALALLQVGKRSLAERELRNLAQGADQELSSGLLAIAAQGNMASLALRLDSILYPNGGDFDGAAYPIPMWTPIGGFKVDRALIYALIHQESRFNPDAKSWAGARGLMQLMPRTASFVARDRKHRRSHLYRPERNIELGQKYIEILLKDDKIQGDLFLMAAAWNGGPGNLNKWRRKTDDLNDPLFFIESLPSRETRGFIERVLSNLWIYRNRLGQPAPSLDAIVAGEWPVYIALGQSAIEVAENNGSRK